MAQDDLEKTWSSVQHASADATRQAEDAIRPLKTEVSAKIDEGLHATGEAARAGSEKVSSGLNKLSENVDTQARQSSRAVGVAAQDGAKALERAGKTFGAGVAERPVETLLLAGVVGYLIGYSMAGRD